MNIYVFKVILILINSCLSFLLMLYSLCSLFFLFKLKCNKVGRIYEYYLNTKDIYLKFIKVRIKLKFLKIFKIN